MNKQAILLSEQDMKDKDEMVKLFSELRRREDKSYLLGSLHTLVAKQSIQENKELLEICTSE